MKTKACVSLHISAEAERRLRFGHPWLYAEAITKSRGEGACGDLAAIYDRRNRLLGVGLYDPASSLRVRVLQRYRPLTLDSRWIEEKLKAALALRTPLLNARHTNAYRLVYGESDGLPGLVIDRYAQTGVIKLYTPAWIPHWETLLKAAIRSLDLARFVLRLSRAVEQANSSAAGLADGAVVWGSKLSHPVIFEENSLLFEADPIRGHKTGFFLDQRDNRSAVCGLSRARTVLDCFAYTGGFSVYAMKGQARAVTLVDTSRPALEAAKRNIALNLKKSRIGAARHTLIQGDGFEAMEKLGKSAARFGMVVLDPPSFANNQQQVVPALEAYARLVKLGLPLLEEGGVFMISSCSASVGAENFFDAVFQAAGQSGCRLNELKRTAHAIDHPVRFPQAAYLKCLFATKARYKRTR